MSGLNLEQGTALCRLLADPSRLRLLLLLEAHELSVAELTEITGLAQSRVSTHLSRLRQFGLVRDRRVGSAALYSAETDALPAAVMSVWEPLRAALDDHQTQADLDAARELIARRRSGQTWAESVAGRMELHYSPGRTWESTARALIRLLDLGEVLDIASGDGVMAELLHARARRMSCVDISPAVLAAAQRRLAKARNVDFLCADMHALPLADNRYDHVLLMHALSYTREPERVILEAARVTRPGGRLVIAAVAAHTHESVLASYDHVNLGIAPETLSALLGRAGLTDIECGISNRETRPPYFEVVTALARKPA